MLPWYNGMKNFAINTSLSIDHHPIVLKDRTKQMFEDLWHRALQNSPKLKFYNMVKSSIDFEPYLFIKNIKKRRAVARLRSSSHNFNIETGRYVDHKTPTNQDEVTWKKCCRVCSNMDAETLISLPFSEPVYEDEQHVLVTCPDYHHLRYQLNDDIKSALMTWESVRLKELFNSKNIGAFSTYIMVILEKRFSETRTRRT